MNLALFLVSLFVSAVCVRHSFTHRARVYNYHLGGSNLVSDFFARVRVSISMISITLTLLVVTVAELAFGGMPKTGENVVIVAFFVLGVLGLIFTVFAEASVAATVDERRKTDSRVKVQVDKLDASSASTSSGDHYRTDGRDRYGPS